VFSEEQYPGCFTPEDIARVKAAHNASVKWYSYLTGDSLPTYKVKLLWNQSIPELAPVGEPTMSESSMDKVWVWKDSNGLTGSCFLKEPVITLEYTFIQGDSFTMVTSTGFPFDARGVTEEETTSHLENAFTGILSLLPADVASNVRQTWNASPEGIREAMVVALTIALTKGAGSLAKLTPAAAEAANASTFTSEQLEALAKFGGPWEAFEAEHSGATIASYYNEFFGEYPLMNTVIRGTFETRDGTQVTVGGRQKIIGGNTVLAVSAKTTAFPNFFVKVLRTADGQGTQVLPWNNNPLGSGGKVATANAFSSNSPFDVSEADGNKRNYQIGTDAVQNVEEDTTQLPSVTHSANNGSLDTDYAAEQDDGVAPKCNGAPEGDSLKTVSDKTICWRIQDGRP